jgi:hypothetical protein
MEMLREQHLRVVVGGKYMITKSADVMNRNVANERFTIYNCDIVTAVGFVTDGSVSFPGHIDINVARSNVYPVMRDAKSREFVLGPKDTLVGEDPDLGELHVVHLPIRYGWAGTVHVLQSTTIRFPNQLEIDLAKNFCHGQAYVAVGRAEWLTQLGIRGLNCDSIFVHASVCETNASHNTSQSHVRQLCHAGD